MSGEAKRFARFIVVGGLNTIVGYALYLLFLPILHHQAAYAVVYVLGIGMQYAMHSRYVFPQKMSWRGLLGYPPIHLILYGVGVTMLYLLVDAGGFSAKIAPLVVIALNIPLGFLLTRAWMMRRAAREISATPSPTTTRTQRFDIAFATIAAGAAVVFALSACAYVLAYGWREPMADQYRQYLPMLTLPFPDSVIALENGHRPIVPNLLRALDLWLGGNQVLLILSGLLFAAATVGIVAWAAWRDARLSWSARAAAVLFASVGVFWLGNARMLMHGNESCQVYLAGFAMAAAGVLAWIAAQRARVWPMVAASGCALVATFSFGSGIAAFPALIVLAIAMRSRPAIVFVPVASLFVALFLYIIVLPGAADVGRGIFVQPLANFDVASRWLAGPWINAWFGLGDPVGGAWLHDRLPEYGLGGWLVASADALTAAIGADAVRGGFASLIGALGLVLVTTLMIRRFLRREAWTPLAAVALALALFGAATAGVIALVRLEYFAQNAEQLYAERYGVWPCLFWLGAGLLVIDALMPTRRLLTSAALVAASLAVCAIAWPTHIGWRGWGAVVDLRAESLAAGYRLGVIDPPYQPTLDEAPSAALAAVLAEMRVRRTAVFADPGDTRLGQTIVPEPIPANAPATVFSEHAFDDTGTGRRVVRIGGMLNYPGARKRRDSLVVIDATGRVVGVALWAPNPALRADVTWPRRERIGITGYAFAPEACAPLTLVIWRQGRRELLRAIATFSSCPADAPG